MAQVKDGYYLASGGSLVGERPITVNTIKLSDGTSVQWVRGYNVDWPLKGFPEEGITFVPLVAMTPERIEAIDYARDLLAHEVREFKDATGREPRYLATLDELLSCLGEADGDENDNS